MRPELRHIITAAVIPLFLIFILYLIMIWEYGMGWELYKLGIYPRETKGVLGILTHPFIHSNLKHLVANTLPLFFLSWCLFYFYHGLATLLITTLWFSCGILTFLIGKPGWHIGASGIIYGLAFFLFFSGVFRRHRPLMAMSLLITFIYGGLVWNMFPFFTPKNTSWEGHISGGLSGLLCAYIFKNRGPQQPPDPFANELDEDEENEEIEDEEKEQDVEERVQIYRNNEEF